MDPVDSLLGPVRDATSIGHGKLESPDSLSTRWAGTFGPQGPGVEKVYVERYEQGRCMARVSLERLRD